LRAGANYEDVVRKLGKPRAKFPENAKGETEVYWDIYVPGKKAVSLFCVDYCKEGSGSLFAKFGTDAKLISYVVSSKAIID
jgi:hypothetical protein